MSPARVSSRHGLPNTLVRLKAIPSEESELITLGDTQCNSIVLPSGYAMRDTISHERKVYIPLCNANLRAFVGLHSRTAGILGI